MADKFIVFCAVQVCDALSTQCVAYEFKVSGFVPGSCVVFGSDLPIGGQGASARGGVLFDWDLDAGKHPDVVSRLNSCSICVVCVTIY